MNPMFYTDGYKLDHRRQYPQGTEYVYSNWTARGSRVPEIDKVVFFGLQHTLQKLTDDFQVNFFDRPVDEVCDEYQRMLDGYLGPDAGKDIGTEHIRALHNLGYLPLEFKALPEGTRVPLRVPMFTVENTHPDFFWVTNYFETILSANLWMPMTSATVAVRIREQLNGWAEKTGEPLDGVGFQGHDFSMRGMSGLDASLLSGMGHLVAFTGTETVPVLAEIEKYYPTDGFIAGTVPATEHSVMCAGGKESEQETIERIGINLYKSGIVSMVMDTWDLWNVLTNILPNLHDKIMARDGKLVIRPDSGDPADIICGTVRYVDKDHYDEQHSFLAETPEEKGAIEVLWDTFGGTINEAGYKVLDSHVGLIYGDAMNPERIEDICSRLASKGFAISPVVFGIGSFNYQFQTRDTFGFAMKATNVVINGEEMAIFKDPKTDNGLKKSLKGRIVVTNSTEDGHLVALDDSFSSQRDTVIDTGFDLLQTVWKNGKFIKHYSFDEVRANVGLV